MANNNVKLSTYLANQVAWARVTDKPAQATRWPAWSEVTDKPSTFTPSTHLQAIANGGTGSTTAQDAVWALFHVANPSDLNDAKRIGSFKISNTTTNTPASGMWGVTLNLTDDSAAGNNGTNGSTWQLVLQSGSTNAWLRCITNAGAWTAYSKLVTSSNYTDYTVTKTGSGASGSWGISVTGSAGSVAWDNVTGKPSTFAPSSHTHNYAGSSSAGGKATSAAASDTVAFTNTTNPSSGTSYYIPFATGNSGQQTVRAAANFFIWRSSNSQYLNLSTSGVTGGITFHTVGETSGAYGDLNSEACTAYRNWKLPNASGTIALVGHTHAWGDITGKPSTFTPSSHSHSEYVTKTNTWTADFNTCTTSGFYRVNNSGANRPGDWGQMIVCHGNSDTIFQLYHHYATNQLYSRGGNPSDVGGSGSWTAWQMIWRAGNSVTSAVWNDYAEYRQCKEKQPGRCVQENDNGWLDRTNARLIPGASIISDTWGFSQGKTDTATTNVAVSGRVLAYTYRDRHEYHAGMSVCSAPDGTIDIMTREEIMMYPDAIVGIVSEVPEYETWGGGEDADRDPVKVDGRIWIKVR